MIVLFLGDVVWVVVGFVYDVFFLCLGWWSGNFF